jgi:hypothetical protein
VSPAVFSPNGDGRRDALRIAFSLTVAAEVNVRIVRDGRWVASPLAASLEPGAHELAWDGARAGGTVRDGPYAAVVEARDSVGAIAFAAPFVADTTAPRVRVLPSRRLLVGVSEPATLRLRLDGTTVRREVRKAGVVWIRGGQQARRVRVLAWDEAGNRGAEVRLVRRGARSGPRQ